MISIVKKYAISFLKALAIALFWVAIWYIIYFAVNNVLLVPAPHSVAKRITELARLENFWGAVVYSLIRIISGFSIGTVLGVLCASVCSIKTVNDLLSPFMTIIKATPVASFIMLAWLWIERDEIPIFISSLMVLPIVWGNVTLGIKQTDKKLLEMARVYSFGKLKTLNKIYIPSALPHFTSAVKTCVGLAWKAGIAAEVLCQPKSSIGGNLFYAKNTLETADVFAWTVTVIIISLILEGIIKKALAKLSAEGK